MDKTTKVIDAKTVEITTTDVVVEQRSSDNIKADIAYRTEQIAFMMADNATDQALLDSLTQYAKDNPVQGDTSGLNQTVSS